MKLTKIQLEELKKVQILITKANEVLNKHLEKYNYDNIIAQTLSQSKNLNNGIPNLIDYLTNDF
jgi:DNA-directed RNA polymerase delta subunit